MTAITDLASAYETMRDNLLSSLNSDYGIDSDEEAGVAYLLLASYMDLLAKISELT